MNWTAFWIWTTAGLIVVPLLARRWRGQDHGPRAALVLLFGGPGVWVCCAFYMLQMLPSLAHTFRAAMERRRREIEEHRRQQWHAEANATITPDQWRRGDWPGKGEFRKPAKRPAKTYEGSPERRNP